MIGAYTAFAAVCGGVFVFSSLITQVNIQCKIRYLILIDRCLQFYVDPSQWRFSSSVIGTLTLSLAILTLLVIPLDIYNVSSSHSLGRCQKNT